MNHSPVGIVCMYVVKLYATSVYLNMVFKFFYRYYEKTQPF